MEADLSLSYGLGVMVGRRFWYGNAHKHLPSTVASQNRDRRPRVGNRARLIRV